MQDMTEKERRDAKMATLYELRLLFTQGEKEEYTRQEIVELLDKIATTNEQLNEERCKVLTELLIGFKRCLFESKMMGMNTFLVYAEVLKI